MLQDYTGSVFVPAFWSLGAEEKFYLLAPLFVLLVARCRRTWSQACVLAAMWAMPVLLRTVASVSGEGTMSYIDYFNRYRSPFHLTCESLVLGFTIAWLSLQTANVAVLQQRRTREVLFWGGTAAVLSWLMPSEILGRLTTSTIVVAQQ
jgi:peptidoglycan/LPS O-acetylase OafA/YrhL